MKSKITVVVFVVLLAVAGVAAFWPFHSRNVLRLPGIVEIQEVRLGSKIGGRVEAVLIHEGDPIYKNQPLVVFEAPELRNQRQQMKAKLDAAEAEWMRAKNGARPEERVAARELMAAAKARHDRAEFGWRVEEKKQAESELNSAKAENEQAAKDWVRVAQLYRDKAVSSMEFEAALAIRDRAKGRFDAAQARFAMMEAGTRKEDRAEAKADWLRTKAQYELLDNGTRKEDKDIAEAKVYELKASLEAIDINIAEATVVAPPELDKAVVEVVAVRPGDLVPPNQPVLRVLRTKDLWVKVYVSETQYGLITLQKEVEVTVDSHPGKVFKGVVIQRANISEFTPRNVQSVDERRHQMFGVKIRVDDPQGVFNAGMAAEVVIPLE